MPGSNGGNIVVPIGVQLELKNVQDIISSLQKAMSNVKPDTKGYSSIVQELSRAEKRADSLASKLKQGFTTNASIQNFTRGFEDLVAMVDTANTKISRFNFDNLILTPQQQVQMADFVKKIQDAKDAYNDIETDKIKKAVASSQDLQKAFKDLKIDIDTTSLEGSLSKVDSKLKEVQANIEKSQNTISSKTAFAEALKSEIADLETLKDTMDKIFNSQDRGADFSQYFDIKGRFKSGGRAALADYMSSMGLDDDTISQVVQLAASKMSDMQDQVNQKIEEIVASKSADRTRALNAASKASTQMGVDKSIEQDLQNVMQQLNNIKLNPELMKSQETMQQVISATIAALSNWKQAQLDASGAGPVAAGNVKTLGDALDTTRDSTASATIALAQLEQQTKTLGSIKNAITMWMGFNQIVRLTKTTIKNIVKDIRDLDKVMTQIAVVTNMSQSDLWNQMGTYQNMAKTYGVATAGVYQVSQIYYQQGLQTSDVMALTTETLKMAKIAGLDYSKAADYMTVAVRGFKMEMTDAQKVVDVYSNLAAKSAVSTTELATAMSKTASSAAAVGSSFENTSAMIAMMVETTRESAENIGSALKSIISRYGEMKTDPAKLIDSEGEALSLNKVDKALQSVGISLQDANHQFRDFDDVILELSSKWDTLDKNSQRYIATIMAGNRQQSRFLALVSDYDRLFELYDEAANSEDAALAQTLKTMDSLETKIQNVKNAFQGFYGNLGLESVFKGTLDVVTNVINRLNEMPKAFGKIPVAAIGTAANIINVIKTLLTTIVSVASVEFTKIKNTIKNAFKEGAAEGAAETKQQIKNLTKEQKQASIAYGAGMAVSAVGAALSTWALTQKVQTKEDAQLRGVKQLGGGILSGFGQGLMTGAMVGGSTAGPYGAIAGALTGIASALPGVISGISDLRHAEEIELKTSREAAQTAQDNATLRKAETRDLENTINKLEKLSEAKYDSNEAYQEWLDYVNQIASTYPQLISMYDSEGNAVIDMAAAYDALAISRSKASQAALEAQEAQLHKTQLELKMMENITNKAIDGTNIGDKWGEGLRNISNIYDYGEQGLDIEFTSGSVNFGKDIVDQVFESIEKYGDYIDVVSLQLKDGALEAIKSWNTDTFGGEEELQSAKTAMADLFYEKFIGPLARNGLLESFGYKDENAVQSIANKLGTEKEITDFYLNLMSQIEEKLESSKELQQQLDEIEQQKKSVDNAFQTWTENYQSDMDYLGKQFVSKFAGDSLMKSIAEKHITNVGEDGILDEEGQAFMKQLYQFYEGLDQDVYKQVTAILAHPENYASQDELKNAITDLLGTTELWDKYLTTSANDTKSYIDDIWGQNKNNQKTFRRNIKGSIEKIDNDKINQAAENLLTVGNGVKVGENGTEIASKYLNSIDKQWTDLVSKQKNEAVATQNAEFLSNTYVNIGQLSEEVNNAMAEILTSAELETREGIQNTIDQIKSYQTENKVSNEDAQIIQTILGQLQERKENLLLNLNTEIQSYVDSISDAIKSVNSNYSKNTSGFDELKDANDILEKINARKTKTGEDQLQFNAVFKFDKTLGKYVFTLKGLQEANNQVMQDLNDQYTDTINQLDETSEILDNLRNESYFNSEMTKEDQIAKLKERSESALYSPEQQAIYGELVQKFEESDLEWGAFYEAHKKELDQLKITAEQELIAAENMTKEAQKTSAFKAIDFSGIAKSEKTFADVKQTIIDYFTAQGTKFSSDELAKSWAQLYYDSFKGGGQAAAEFYKKEQLANDREVDPEVYNEILNQPVNAVKSLSDKLKNSLGQGEIQLTKAEQVVLDVGEDVTSMGADELAERYTELIQKVREGVATGASDIASANEAIMQQEFGEELILDQQTAALKSLTSTNITLDGLKSLANTMGVLKDIDDNFKIADLAGIETIDGKQYITDIAAFLEDFNTLLEHPLDEADLKAISDNISLADKSSLADTVVEATNSVSDSIASQIKNLTSAGIGKAVNITYLTDRLSKESLPELAKILGTTEKDLEDGIITTTKNTSTNIVELMRRIAKRDTAGLDIDESGIQQITQIYSDMVKSAISELSSAQVGSRLSADTAAILAGYNSAWKTQLQEDGTIIIQSASDLIKAAQDTYEMISAQYEAGTSSLAELNAAAKGVEDSKNAGKRIAIDAAQTLIEQRDQITSDAIESLANALGIDFNILLEAFEIQENGYYKVDNTKLIGLIGKAGSQVDDYLLGVVNASYESMQNAFDSMSNGFSNPQEALENLQKINSELDTKYKFEDLYTVNQISGKIMPTVLGLQESLRAANKSAQNAITTTADSLQQEQEQLENLPTDYYSEFSIKELDNSEEIIADFGKFLNANKEKYGANKNKAWNDYLEQRKQDIQTQIENADEAEAALAALMAADKSVKLKAIDFSGIASSSKTFAESRASLQEYLTAKYAEDTSKTAEDIEAEAKQLFESIRGGGFDAAEKYKASADEAFDPEVYNEILNQPAQAAKSLLDKLNNSIGQERIQLTKAEQTLLRLNAEITDIGADELADSYDELLTTLKKGLINGSITLQEYNNAIATANKSSSEKLTEKADALTTFLTSGALTVDALSTLATSFGTSLKQNFNIKEIEGLRTDINGNTVVDDVHAFLRSFNKITSDYLDIDAIESALDMQDKSKITSAAVDAENSIIESIANEISNIQSAGIDKKVNLTYLQNKIGDNSLSKIFGYAYENGILTVTQAVKANMYDSIKNLKSELSEQGYDTAELDETLINYVDSAISELSEFTGEMTVSDNTAQIIASQSQLLKAELILNGKIAIDSVEKFAMAANAVYTEVSQQYNSGLTNLTQLNSSYANIVKSNLAKQSAGFTMLTTASSFDLTSLQNFLNVYNKKLSDYVDNFGNMTTAGAAAGLQSLGNGNYKIVDWSNFINQLGITADRLSSEYIDAYVSWLQNAADTDTSVGARTALMTSLVPNMQKLTYAQIGQIAKTFNMTVESILGMLEGYENSDGTFNGGGLLKSLDFDKSNKEFQQAILNQRKTVASNLTSAITQYVQAGSDGFISSYDTFALDSAVNEYIEGMAALGENIEADKEKMRNILQGGGKDAVLLGQRIAAMGQQELSAADIEALYRGAVSPYINAIDKVVAKPGEIVDKITADIITQSGGQVSSIGASGEYVVESAANLYEAYKAILDQLSGAGEATLSELNSVAAKMLANRDGEQPIIDALGDAAGMTFDRFGEILADAGIQLTEDMIDYLEATGIAELPGGNKIKIVDFQAFADLMHWDANSEEYISAFKAYNDSLINMNRQVERSILEEAKNVASAKGGDWVNLTQLVAKINDGLSVYGSENRDLYQLNSKLQKYGAKIEDGILKLDDSANIPAIMQEIAQVAAESGNLLSSELAELADAVSDAIKGYADLIKGAISGSLSNVQAEQLQDWATQTGIGELQFTQTADGLKVANDQAIQLYQELNKIDSMQGKLVFKDLVDAMSSDKGGRFENISKTTAEIARAQKQIAINQNKIDALNQRSDRVDNKRIQALEEQNSELREQIGLYQQIQQAQSVDPNQYKFMDRDLPDSLQGPINYWDSVGKAFSAMNEADKTGRMEINDFYNIVNEMENLANTAGTTFELAGYKIGGEASEAAKLIEAGMLALDNIDGKGVKINLQELGLDFSSGADDAKNSFHKGVQAFAKSQVEMLDAAIKVLEVVVAMEELGDIDVSGNNNGHIDIGEIFGPDFSIEDGFDKKYSDACDVLLQKAEGDNDLKDALEKVKVNGHSMYEMLDAARGTIDEQKTKFLALNMSEEQYAAVIDAFYQAMLNGDYNLETIQSSVWEILDQLMPDGTTIDLGDRTLLISGGTHTMIDWSSESAEKALSLFDGELEDQKREVLAAVQRYSNGQGSQIDALITLSLAGKIKINTDNGKTTIEGPNGESIDPDSIDGQKILAKAALEHAGITDGKVLPPTDMGVIYAEGTTKLGNQTIKVRSDGKGQVQYYSEKLGQYFNNTDALLKGEYIDMRNNARDDGIEFPDYETWVYQTYGIHINTTTKFINKNGEEIDPTNDPEFQSALRKFMSQSQQKIQDALHEAESDNKGHYTLKLPGGEAITVDAKSPEEAAAKLEAEIKAAYAPMADSVATGITQAFTATDGQNGNAVQNAITSAIQSALGVNVGENQGNSLPMPEITLAPQGLKIDISQAGEPELTTATETQDVQVTEVTLKPDGVKINLSEAPKPTLEGADEETEDISSGEVTLKPDSVILNVSDKKPELSDTSTETTDIPIGEVSLKPTSTKINADTLDVSSLKEKIQTELSNLNFDVNINPKVNTTSDGEGADNSGVSGLSGAISSLNENATAAAKQISDIATKSAEITSTEFVSISSAIKDVKSSETVSATGAINDVKSLQTVAATQAINGVKSMQTILAAAAINGIGSRNAENAQSAINNINPGGAINAKAAINTISSTNAIMAKTAINAIDSTNAAAAKKTIGEIAAPSSLSTKMTLSVSAKGNMPGVANAKGSLALAHGTRKTLMGELGPELVVSNGRYFLAGENGAEFVDLASDAIVFNHLQTRRLFEQGAIGGRGHALVNEREAVSFAKGKIPFSGFAHADLKAKEQSDTGTGSRNTEAKQFNKTITAKLNKTTGKINWLKGVLEDSSLVSNGTKTKTTQFSVEPGKTKSLTAKVSPLSWKSEMKDASYQRGTGEFSRELGRYTAAKGNISSIGPAMASASAALSALKQLRAMWQSLLGASLKDMGGSPKGSGGGGGGGGGGDTAKEVEGILQEVERWYNWLALIEEKQNQINILTKKYDLLVSRNESNEKRIENLKTQAKLLKDQYTTAQQLVIEQKAYRTNQAKEMNKGLLGAFYHINTKTGKISFKNDDSFIEFMEKRFSKDEIDKYIKTKDNGEKVLQLKDLTRAKTKKELEKDFKNINYAKSISKADYDKLNDIDKELYKEETNKDETTYKLQDNALKIYQKKHAEDETNVKNMKRAVKTGLDFITELTRTNEAGKAIYSAADQLAMIDAMGFYSKDLDTGVDKSQDGWEATVVQNFFDKIENDKAEIESLNQSIQEQQEAMLEYEKAIQEINNQYHEMAKPIEAVTDHLEEWYEWSRKIVTTQNDLNILTKKYQTLTYRTGDNIESQVNNLKEQIEKTLSLRDSTQKTIDEMNTKRKTMKSQMSNFGIWFTYDEDGNLIYNNAKTISNKSKFNITSYKEKISSRDGSYLRKINSEERDKTWRDKQFTNLGLKAANDSSTFTSLQDEYNQESDIPTAYKGLYTQVDGKWVLGTKETTSKKKRARFRKKVHTAQNNVRDYDNGVNILDTVKETADFSSLINDPEKFFNKLTSTDANGNAVYDGRQQMQILEQMGLGNAMAEMSQLSSWTTASEEEKIEAAKKYLETIKEMPEEYNKLLDQINENKEQLIEYKNQVMEVNNQIKELLKPIDGVTDHLEAWYTWTRKTTDAQNKLNILTAKYSKLEKESGDQTANKISNLQKQGEQIEAQILANTNEQVLRKKNYNTEKKKILEGPMRRFFTKDENGSIIYNDAALANVNKTTSFSYEKLVNNSIETKRIGENDYTWKSFKKAKLNGKKWSELSKEERSAIQNEWDLATIATTIKKSTFEQFFGDAIGEKGITPKDFINELTRINKNGQAAHSLQEQRAVLEAAGLKSQMAAVYGQGNWNDLSAEQRNEAAKTYLETIAETPDKVNELKDALKAVEVEGINLREQILNINQQIRELTKPIQGVTDHLESWYTWTQKVNEAQNQLNILTARYNRIQAEFIAKPKSVIRNLYSQEAELLKQQEGINKERKEREKQRNKEIKEDLETTNTKLKKIYTADKSGRVVYSNAKIRKDKTDAITYEVTKIKKDKNGKDKIDENGVLETYTSRGKTTAFNNITPQQLIEKLTAVQANGQSKYSADVQAQILHKLGFDELMRIDQNTGEEYYRTWAEATKEQRETAAKAILEYLKSYPDTMNSELDTIQQLLAENENIEKSILDIKNQLIDNEISLENALMEAYLEEKQVEIDNNEKLKDLISDAANNLVDGLNDALKKEKDRYDRQDKRKELDDLQRQLAIVQRSGGSLSQINDLQKQITSKQKDMYFSEQQAQIDAIEAASDKQIEKLDKQIELLQNALDYAKKNGLYWEEIRRRMDTWGLDKITQYLQTIESIRSSSSLQQQQAENENREIAGLYKYSQKKTKYTQNLINSDNYKNFVTDENRNRLISAIEKGYEEKYVETGKAEDAKLGARNAIRKELGQISWEEEIYPTLKEQQAFKDLKKSKNITNEDIKNLYIKTFAANLTSKNSYDKEEAKEAAKNALIKKWGFTDIKFATGGLIDFTGPAWVDGTKNKPESILNAEQTKFLRENLLGNVSALNTLVSNFKESILGMANASTYNSINRNNEDNISIENLTFTMEVKNINNDYDARRAGQQVFEEMVRIARKSGNTSVARR